MNQIDNNWVAAHTKHRLVKGHKKTFGHVLVIAESPGKIGSRSFSSAKTACIFRTSTPEVTESTLMEKAL